MKYLIGNRPELLNEHSLRALIKLIRATIRWHRDQKGDDRCWLDDFKVWQMAFDRITVLYFLNFDTGMAICRIYYAFRRSDKADPIPEDAIVDKRLWNADLDKMNAGELRLELEKLQTAIINHRDIEDRPRTFKDDRALYSVLPEKIPADFRLPAVEDFLGERKAPNAGCPSFWRSHGECLARCHKFHQWGPCL